MTWLCHARARNATRLAVFCIFRISRPHEEMWLGRARDSVDMTLQGRRCAPAGAEGERSSLCADTATRFREHRECNASFKRNRSPISSGKFARNFGHTGYTALRIGGNAA
jgi:hypothetical protein